MPLAPARRRPTPRSSGRRRAFEPWRRRRARGPGRGCCAGSPSVVDAHLEELAQLEVRNSGHTIGNARWEAGNVRDVLDYYAGAPERLTGRQIPVPGGLDVTFHEPLGVVGVIVPWNFPMPIAGWGFAPALAAGNTVVLKPAELTPLTALRLAELALRGRPARGRVHRAARARAAWSGERFVTHPAVRKVCFTGSTEVGKRIMARLRRPGEAGDAGAGRQERQHRLRRRRPGDGRPPPRRTRSSTTPARTAAPAPGSWCSARCTTGSWSCWSRRCAAFRVEDPALDTAEMGPLISAGAAGPASPSYVDGADVAFPARARRRRASGTRRRCCSPTRRRDRHWREEIFGPVRVGAAVRRRGRRGPAGQRHRVRPVRLDLDPRRRAGRCGWPGRVETGNLSVNSHSSVRYWTPFGGMKQSGLGRELGPDALHAFTDVKNVFISDGASGGQLCEGRLAGPGRGDHRGGQRDRAGHRPAVRRRGRPGGLRRHRRRRPGRRPPTRSAASSSPATWPTRRRCGRCSTGWSSGTAGSTSRSTTPASRRPTTTRSWTPAWTPGSGCCGSTSPASTCAASTSIPHMRRQGKGSIINTASFVALMGAATSQIAYTASKGGVLAMTRELGVQFAREGIRVNALCPGPVATPLLHGAVRQGPGAGRPAAGARADGPVRRAGGDRRRGGVPGQRRRLVHDRRRSSSSTAGSPARTSPRCEPAADRGQVTARVRAAARSG